MKKTILFLVAVMAAAVSGSKLSAQQNTLTLKGTGPGVKANPLLLFDDSENNRIGWLGYGSINSPNMFIYNLQPGGHLLINSNVGIGTDTPEVKLDINGSVQLPSGGNGFAFLKFKYNSSDNSSRSWYMANDLFNWGDFGIYQSTSQTDNDLSKIVYNHRFYINKIGNIGIGTTSPSEKLEIYNSNTTPAVISLKSSRNDYAFVDVGRLCAKQDAVEVSRIGMPRAGGSNTGFLTFWTKESNAGSLTEKMRINADGNVGIGTTLTNGYKLAVNGTIGAREIVVNTDTWADFVFNSDYRLMPLAEVESFIQANNHLPDVPSETDVKANGINVAEMNAKLLQKIEELTLYMIEQNKQTQQLIKDNKNLKKDNEKLTNRVETLEKK